MLSKSVYETDVRVRREAEALAGAGHKVILMCLGPSHSPSNGVDVIGLGEVTGLKGHADSRRNVLYRAARWVLLPSHRRISNRQFATRVREASETLDLDVDVVHAHDFPGLEAAAGLQAIEQSRLVYDSHEYWRGMPRHGMPDPIGRAFDRRRERLLAQRADAVITVSDGAAGLLANQLQIDEVHVVRNTFPVSGDRFPPESPKGAVYAGRIGPGRDLKTVFSAGVWDDLGLTLHLMGPTDGHLETPPSVVVHPAAPLPVVDELLTSAGIALVPLTRGPQNHDVALPNKLFQAIAVGVPVVTANLPEMADLVRTHDLGETYEPGNTGSLDHAIGSVVDRYQSLVDSVRRSAPSFDWAHDSGVLVSIYEAMAAREKPPRPTGYPTPND